MQRDADAVVTGRLAVAERTDRYIRAESRPEDPLALGRAQVMSGSPASVVTVRVGDDRAIDRLPRVDMEIACGAVEPAVGDTEQRWCD